jgi:hypothetical protein
MKAGKAMTVELKPVKVSLGVYVISNNEISPYRVCDIDCLYMPQPPPSPDFCDTPFLFGNVIELLHNIKVGESISKICEIFWIPESDNFKIELFKIMQAYSRYCNHFGNDSDAPVFYVRNFAQKEGV